MGAINLQTCIRYEVQIQRGSEYEIYSFRKDSKGEWCYLECFISDMHGRVDGYDVWSETFQEFINVDLRTKKSDYYKDRFKEIQDLLKLAIVEHECQKGVAL